MSLYLSAIRSGCVRREELILPHRQSSRQRWRIEMVRNAVFLMVATLMTATAFGGTLAMMSASVPSSDYAVPVA